MKGLKYLDSSTVQVRNQLVVPKIAAERMKLKKGDLVGFFEVEGNPDLIVIARVNVVVSSDQQQ